MVVASVVLISVVILAAWFLGQLAQGGKEGAEGPAGAVWEMGSDGALTALAYAVIPLILPLLPVVVAQENVTKDSSRVLLQLSVAAPSPKWGIVIGKFVGTFAAMSVVVLPLSLGSAWLIQGASGTDLDDDLVVGFVASNLILLALYLLLALFIGIRLAPGAVAALSFLAWIGFHALRPTAFILLGQLAGIFRLGDAPLFEYIWTDLFSFTGLYQGLLAAFVPESLGFVMLPGQSMAGATLVAALVPWASLAWVVAFLTLLTVYLGGIPSR